MSSPAQTPEGLIPIHPRIDFRAVHPVTGHSFRAVDWALPGHWTLALMEGEGQPGRAWVEMPYSTALTAPCWLGTDDASRELSFTPRTCWWNGDALGHAWHHRTEKPIELRVKKIREARRVIVVNCLSAWYGDSVNLLLRLNALRQPDLGIVALIPPPIERLLPDYLAEAWIVQGGGKPNEWNEALNRRVKEELGRFEAAFLPRIFKLAALEPDELRDVTGVAPFPRRQWMERLLEKPVVTFFTREDRCWAPQPDDRLNPWLRGPLRPIRTLLAKWRLARGPGRQRQQIIALAGQLQKLSPRLEFAVCGPGRGQPFPASIKDLRHEQMTDETNRAWDEQSARSHVLVAVHGSHTAPRNGMAGAYIELMPPGRWINLLTNIFVTMPAPREALYTYRFVPLAMSPVELADIVLSVLYNYPIVEAAYGNSLNEPISDADYARLQEMQQARHQALAECDPRVIRFALP